MRMCYFMFAYIDQLFKATTNVKFPHFIKKEEKMSRQVVTGPQCWSAAILPLTSGAQTASKRQRSAKRPAPQSMFQASKDSDPRVTSAPS